MSCERMRALLPDRWAGTLEATDVRALDAHLAGCAGCRAEAAELTALWQALGALADGPEAAPPATGRPDAVLRAYRAGLDDAAPASAGSGTARRPWGWQPAWAALAAACLLAGVILGREMASAPAGDEVAALRGEVHGMRQMLALSLLQQQSAAERLRGVTWSYRLEQPARPVLDALLEAVNHDVNVNVRLSAVEALRAFADDAAVRGGLVDAIVRQTSPLVQVALIDLVVEIQERRAIEVLRRIRNDAAADEAVRQRAGWGLEQLI